MFWRVIHSLNTGSETGTIFLDVISGVAKALCELAVVAGDRANAINFIQRKKH